MEGLQRWPDSAWFANAAASVDSEHANYPAALADYQIAMTKNPALRPVDAVQVLRLLRLTDPAAASQRQAEFARISPIVHNLMLLEPGVPLPEGPYRSLGLLANGHIDEAVAAAANTPMAARVLRLAAGSRGASAELRTRATRLPASEGVDEQTVWIALAEGDNADDPAIAAVLDNIGKEYDSPDTVTKVQRFLALSRSGNTVAAERSLDGVPFTLRAQAFVAGAYLLGDQTPETWRTYARSVLFAGERPYMG